MAFASCNPVGVTAEVVAGSATECTLEFPYSMTLAGQVVDAGGAPVAGATVEIAPPGCSRCDAQPAAVTATDGTFVVRGCSSQCLVGTRAEGHAASGLYFVDGKPGATEQVRIELTHPGGCVEGIVIDQQGGPVADAVVKVGEGRTEAIDLTMRGAQPLPAQVRTGPDGRFVAIGVPPGTQPVQVRSPGLAPWSGTCNVTAGVTTSTRIVLSVGVTCIGTVRDEAGRPVAGVAVQVGAMGEFVQFLTRTAADGAFVLTGLPVGDTALTATGKEGIGKGEARVAGAAGESVRCDIVLVAGLNFRLRVTDENGAPVAGAQGLCQAEGDGPRWGAGLWTDSDGRALVLDCPGARTLVLRLAASGFVALERKGIDPRAGDLYLRLQRDTTVRARITGRIVGPEGQRAGAVSVQVVRRWPQEYVQAVLGDDGAFAVEVQAGEWWVQVESREHPPETSGRRQLQPGAAWNIGTIELVRGGTLVVHAPATGVLDCKVLNEQEHVEGDVNTAVSPATSGWLRPGAYFLTVRGKGVAAQTLPFSIKAGEQTALTVHPGPGVRQAVEFVHADRDRESPGTVIFTVRQKGVLVAWCQAFRERTGPLQYEIWLAPGEYSLKVRDSQPDSTATFTVGNVEGPPVRIELR